MNSLLRKSAVLFLLIGFNLTAQNNLIPAPVSFVQQEGEFILRKKTTLFFKDLNSENQQIASSHFKSLGQFDFKITTIQPTIKEPFIEIEINKTADEKLGTEGYSLEINKQKISLKANATAGLFYGLQSFDQLVPVAELKADFVAIPSCTILDYPRFQWRGLMLDVSRHFFTVNEVKQYIDVMAKYKFNILHWHLTDDNGWRIEIKALPKLTQVGAWRVERFGKFGEREAPLLDEKTTYGGFYTQEQVKEIVNYAATKQVAILPEIDVPGHSMALLAAYPELSTLKEPKRVNPGSKFSDWHGDGTFTMTIENSLNPADENVYRTLDVIFGEIAALFPHPYIHLGGDECYHGYWQKDAGCQALMEKENLKDVKELQSYFIKRVGKIIASKGKKVMGWDEILYGGLADNAAVMSWRGLEGGIQAAKQGHQVVMSPNSFAYFDYTQGDLSVEVPVYSSLFLKKVYQFEPVPEGVDSKYILGGQANLWTEKIPTIQHAFYMTYPRAFAISETVWSPAQHKNWDHFVQRVENHFARFDAAEIPISKAVYDPVVKTKMVDKKLMCVLSCELPNTEVYYTIDGTFPGKYSMKYSTPFEIPKGDVTFRTVSYREGKPIGRVLTLSREQLQKRAGK